MDYYQAIDVKQLTKWNWWCVGQYYGIIVPVLWLTPLHISIQQSHNLSSVQVQIVLAEN